MKILLENGRNQIYRRCPNCGTFIPGNREKRAHTFFKLSLISLFMLNTTTLLSISLQFSGPGWEYPPGVYEALGVLTVIKWVFRIVLIASTMCSFSVFKQQSGICKTASICWLVISTLMGGMGIIPQIQSYLADYWWQCFLPFLIVFVVLYFARKKTGEELDQATAKCSNCGYDASVKKAKRADRYLGLSLIWLVSMNILTLASASLSLFVFEYEHIPESYKILMVLLIAKYILRIIFLVSVILGFAAIKKQKAAFKFAFAVWLAVSTFIGFVTRSSGIESLLWDYRVVSYLPFLAVFLILYFTRKKIQIG